MASLLSLDFPFHLLLSTIVGQVTPRAFPPPSKQALILVQPKTVVRWRAQFKLYWTWLSLHRVRMRRTCVSRELRELIFRMVAENTNWGAPRIHGELKMLGFDIQSEAYCDGCGMRRGTPSRRNDGQHF